MGAPDIWLLAITVPTDIPDEKLPLKNTSARITFQGYADNLELNVKFNVMWGWPSSPFLSQPQSNSSIHWPTCRSVIWLDCQVLIIDAAETSRSVHKKLFSPTSLLVTPVTSYFLNFFFYRRWKMVFCKAKKRGLKKKREKAKRGGVTGRLKWGFCPEARLHPYSVAGNKTGGKLLDWRNFKKQLPLIDCHF